MKPQVSGYYWWRSGPACPWYIVKVDINTGYFYMCGSVEVDGVGFEKEEEWIGPLSPEKQ